MPAHLSKEQIASYQDRQMPPAELIAADQHLASSESCRREMVTGIDLDSALTANRNSVLDSHLSYEQLEAYVDGRISDADNKILLTHISACRMCAEELHDLEGFHREIGRAHV